MKKIDFAKVATSVVATGAGAAVARYGGAKIIAKLNAKVDAGTATAEEKAKKKKMNSWIVNGAKVVAGAVLVPAVVKGAKYSDAVAAFSAGMIAEGALSIAVEQGWVAGVGAKRPLYLKYRRVAGSSDDYTRVAGEAANAL